MLNPLAVLADILVAGIVPIWQDCCLLLNPLLEWLPPVLLLLLVLHHLPNTSNVGFPTLGICGSITLSKSISIETLVVVDDVPSAPVVLDCKYSPAPRTSSSKTWPRAWLLLFPNQCWRKTQPTYALCPTITSIGNSIDPLRNNIIFECRVKPLVPMSTASIFWYPVPFLVSAKLVGSRAIPSIK